MRPFSADEGSTQDPRPCDSDHGRGREWGGSAMTLTHSGFCNGPFAGADNKPHAPGDFDPGMGSGTPPAGGPGPTLTGPGAHPNQCGTIMFSRHPIEGETPSTFGAGASNDPIAGAVTPETGLTSTPSMTSAGIQMGDAKTQFGNWPGDSDVPGSRSCGDSDVPGLEAESEVMGHWTRPQSSSVVLGTLRALKQPGAAGGL